MCRIKLFCLLTLLSFLLFIPNAQGNKNSQTKVLYFYIERCHFYQIEIPHVDQIKEYWYGKVDWNSYDINEWSNRNLMNEYNVSEVPQAVIECNNQSFRIIRTEGFVGNLSAFAYNINQTIYKCHVGKIESEFLIANLILLFIFLIFLAVYLIRKRVKRKKPGKRKVRKRRKS